MNNELICPYCDSDDVSGISRTIDVFTCNDCGALFDVIEATPAKELRRPAKFYDDDDD